MKTFFRTLFSLISLPFLIPWFLADKLFAFLIQPIIFKKYRLKLSRGQQWAQRGIKILPPLLLGYYLLHKTIVFFKTAPSFWLGVRYIGRLFLQIYNDAMKTLQLLVTPMNHLLYYLQGGNLRIWDFLGSLYFCTVPILIIVNFVYRSLKTRSSLSKAVRLRDKAIRDVNIVQFSQAAKADEIFLGLDLIADSQPFYIKRDWLKGHVQVVGAPGTGKTESIIQPIWFQEMRRNVATFVIDGKASRQNIDRFYTIAVSLAQGRDIYYFNPLDPGRSATYNPLLCGTASEVKSKIMNSIDWQQRPASSRERLDSALMIFLRAMEETNTSFNLRELLEYFQSRGFLARQSERVADFYVKHGLQEIQMNYSAFQASVAFFIGLLRDLMQSGYGELLNTDRPQIDIAEIYHGHRDCYFTLPMQSHESATRFLGQLILQDIAHCFHRLALQGGENSAKEGLLIIDEMAKFVSPFFIQLLEACRGVGVSVCYSNQSLAELDDPNLNLSKVFINQLIDHTNIVCCFQLGSPDSIQMMQDRIGRVETIGKGERTFNLADPNFLKHLEVGRCVVFMRRPRFLSVLKTGYFKFDELLPFGCQDRDRSD